MFIFLFYVLLFPYNTRQSKSMHGCPLCNEEMVEAERQSLRERVQDMEKKLLEQTDEMTCLRSTLADALRRISHMEAAKAAAAPRSPACNGARLGGSGGGVRLRGGVSERARDPHRRATSYIPGRVAPPSPAPAPQATSSNRRNHLYQSSSSLYSDGHSSSSASPAPSPSPTHHHISTTPTPLHSSRHHNHHNHHATTTHNSHSTTTHTSSFLSRSTQSLTKRWSSTIDFTSNGSTSNGHLFVNGTCPTHSTTSNGHNNAGTSHLSPSVNSNLSRRHTGGGSMHNLTSLRPPPIGPATTPPHKPRREPQYHAEEGVVRAYIRGRPVSLHVPSHLRNTYTPATPAPAPPAKLELDWVYGYRGRDCRNNLQQLPTGEIVYFVAAVVVLYSVEEQLQRHYLAHTNDIKCLAVHPSRLLVATGQAAGSSRSDTRPHIRVWDSVSLATLHILGISDFERSVTCVAFSRSDGGALLVAVDEAPEHNMSVWEWSRGQRGYKLLESKCSSDPVLSVEFSPVDRATIITCGKNNITFWVYESGMLAKRMGVFETRERPKYVTAIAFLDTGDVLSGDSNGNLLIWYRGGNTVAHAVRGAHDGPVFSILIQKTGHIVTAGKDGRIIEWDADLNRTGHVIKVPDKYGAPRTVTNGRGGRLMVGTTRNNILAGSFDLSLQPVMQGHCEEVWALACHPTQQQFMTGGYDKTCVLWDSMAHAQVWTTNFAESIQCGCFSPCGGVVVAGGVSGYWAAMDAQTRELRQETRDGTEPIQVVRFSPDGQYLAVGSRDGSIYVYQVTDSATRYSRLGKCQGHTSAVVHLDWSSDSQYLQSNSVEYDLFFWQAALCRQVAQSSQLRDVSWATRTCPVSFHSLGAWQDDAAEVLATCQAHKADILAVGELNGNITLLTSPACRQKASGVSHGGHGSMVTNLEFLPNDTRLISCGSRDAAIMQWQLIINN